tara:strand:+ start:182 stop:295 length:114 start_codon:yes stop_codon:yes gene_type:complete
MDKNKEKKLYKLNKTKELRKKEYFEFLNNFLALFLLI